MPPGVTIRGAAVRSMKKIQWWPKGGEVVALPVPEQLPLSEQRRLG